MKLLYFECNMGAAGDMLTASLYELMTDAQKQTFLETMNHLSEEITVQAVPAATKDICGTRIRVLVNGQEEEIRDVPPHEHEPGSADRHGHGHHEHGPHEHSHHHEHAGSHGSAPEHEHEHPDRHAHAHHHTAPAQISAILSSFDVPENVRRHAQAVYDSLAAAEAQAHGMPVTDIHFHEVGSMDAVADVTGVCLALEILKPDRILCSPVHVGSGEVHCAHGILPVPAPATAYLLRGVPTYGGQIRGELCTPTGAALLSHFAEDFGPMPVMKTENIGYGIGKKEFPAANCVRAFLGVGMQESGHGNAMPQADAEGGLLQDEIAELCCYIDDMTAEELAFAAQRLMENGALDTAAAPVTMKKGRAAVELTVLCRTTDEQRMAQAVLRETTTQGLRVRHCRRYLLSPSVREAETSYGSVRIKHAQGADILHEKPEYEDAARIARETGLPIRQVSQTIMREAGTQADITEREVRHE